MRTGFGERMNMIVQDAYEQYKKAESEFLEAKKNADAFPFKNNMDADYYQKYSTAQHAYMVARNEKAEMERMLREDTVKRIENLREELVEVIESETAVKPEQIDGNMMELLKSGILTSKDYARMLEQCKSKNNGTMARLICKYASEAAEERQRKHGTSDNEAFELYRIGESTEEFDGSENLRLFDEVASGYRYHYSRNLTPDMWATWDELNAETLEMI